MNTNTHAIPRKPIHDAGMLYHCGTSQVQASAVATINLVITDDGLEHLLPKGLGPRESHLRNSWSTRINGQITYYVYCAILVEMFGRCLSVSCR